MPPDLRHSKGCVNRHPIQRAVCNINLDREIRGRVRAQVQLLLTQHPRGIRDPEATIWFEAPAATTTPQRDRATEHALHMMFQGKSSDQGTEKIRRCLVRE